MDNSGSVRMQPERCRHEPTRHLSKWRQIEQQLQCDGQMHEPTGHLSKWWWTEQQLLLGGCGGRRREPTERLSKWPHIEQHMQLGLRSRGSLVEAVLDAAFWVFRRPTNPTKPRMGAWLDSSTASWPEHVQDVPAGQPLPTVPLAEQIRVTEQLDAAVKNNMPSCVCACCSEMKSAVQAHGYQFGNIPNVHQLRADVWRMLAVARPAQVVTWLPVAAAPGGRAPPLPEPALPWGFQKYVAQWAFYREDGAHQASWCTDHLGNTGAYGFPEDFPPHEAGPSSLPRRCRCETDGVDDEQESILSDEEVEVDATWPQDTDGQHEEWMLPSWLPQPGMEPRPDPTAPGGRIPEAALARYDGGDVPEINQDGQHLEWPTVLEANILGLGHVQQQIYTLKVKNRLPDLQPITVTMHGIAMVNPSLDHWVDTIPCSAVSLPENITVLCMDVVSSKEELLEKLKSAKVLSIRAANIVAWVNYLSNLTSERHIDDQAMKEWQAMDPECHKWTTHRRMLVSRSSKFWCLLSLTHLCRDHVMMHETRWSYTILDYSREDVLASNFPTAFLYTEGGLHPLGMSNRTFFQHVSTCVPRRQLSGNLLMLVRMVDVLNMEDAKVQTWVTVKSCQQDIDTVGPIPREAVKAMADILALLKSHPDHHHLLQDMSPLVHTLITSLRAAAVVAAGQFLEFGEDGALLWEERVMYKWWRVRNNPYTSQALLNTVKLAFMDILFGFKPGDKRQSNPDCFCGTMFHICICYMAACAGLGVEATVPFAARRGIVTLCHRFILRAKALLGLVGAACRASTIHKFWRELKVQVYVLGIRCIVACQ
ncbi:hypothetical protein VOLCADRAFT_100616 [Volvox carteri f. nagariensis]|uniref:DUF6570 domain-containing protein n=1 Tax=Volvox carteri f. nagariensis TaxID=3068 RepID=D8UKM8_VOLCA|nr:uncharacterized protein VOLCADRAFT_100616 [Volvox carteri f. nagariensis]EFJ39716.1 hypothetical protein VOLCADRAFT_100616 [Volvox carteri f. nagariensis]|eukprot:XP_002959223.1 hypothetical protein VOLCADRAFT_100616 [Volvox carteri f. nagariensis]